MVDVVRDAGGTLEITSVPAVSASAAAGLAARLESQPGVVAADVESVRHVHGTGLDPLLARATHLHQVKAPQAWPASTGRGVVVAVLDEAVQTDHPDLAGRVLPQVDLAPVDTDPAYSEGHGTAVAGTVAASWQNAEGAAGVAPGATILPVRVCNDRGCLSADVAEGVVYAADHGADVINLSLGGASASEVERAAISYAVKKGVVVVASAGNSGAACSEEVTTGCGNPVGYPAAFPDVISVSSADPAGVHGWATHNEFVDISAPGQGVVVPRPWSRYDVAKGTSFSAPQVSGAIADVLAVNPSLQPAAVRTLLQESSVRLAGWDGYGSGLLDVQAAVGRAVDGGVLDRADGSTVYTRAGVSRTVQGEILKRYRAAGAQSGELGWPQSDEIGFPGGASSVFTWGHVVWTPWTGAQIVKGAVLDRWLTMGGVFSYLGAPRGEEVRIGRGVFQEFNGGLVYWTPQTGAQAVRGEILREYASTGWERGFLGFPVTSESHLQGGAFSTFEGGSVYWSPRTGAHTVRGALRDAWASTGWEAGYLGYPLSDEYAVPGGVRQDFQGRSLLFTWATGKVTEVR